MMVMNDATMSESIGGTLKPGMRVRVLQQIPHGGGGGDGDWSTTIEGEVVSFGQAKTGAWFAGSKDDRLWLDRVEIRKDDGEITVCNLDQYSRVEVVVE